VEVGDHFVVGKAQWPLKAEKGTRMRVADVANAFRVSCSAPSSHLQARLTLLSDTLETASDFMLGGKHVSAGLLLLNVNGSNVSCIEQVQKELQNSCDVHLEFGVSEVDLAEMGQSSHSVNESSCVSLLLSMLVPEGRLIDTFAQAHPEAENRFTCWNQHLNLRYSNCGARLDYVLCDVSLAHSLVATPTDQLPGASSRFAGHTSQAALDAATSFGRWHQAPRKEVYGEEAGLSVQQDDMKLNETQFVPPHTGMIYTPPSYSDHVAACAVFRGSSFLRGPVSVSEKETRRCTPWTAQPDLAVFFSRGTKRQHGSA